MFFQLSLAKTVIYTMHSVHVLALLPHYLESLMTTDQLKLFYAILETKNSWGKNEIRTVLLEVVSGIRTTV